MILITGGAGYIGSHTAINFINSGYEIVIFDNLENGHIETVNMLKNLGNIHFIKGDLKNKTDIESVFKQYNIDAVLHFAGYIEVAQSVSNPANYYHNNITGTLNLLDSMTENRVNKLVFSSTCAIYGEPKYIPLDENHPKNPINPYGKTKYMIEQILDDFDNAYGLKSIRLRYFNVVGADSQLRTGEWHEPETHLIPNILKSIFDKNRTFNIYGTDYDTVDGTCIRDYVNVEDLAQAHRLAYLYLMENNTSDCFNLGTEKGSSVKEIFNTVKSVTGEEINVKYLERRAGDAAILLANSSKAKKLLNWSCTHSLNDSIKTAYLWEKSKNFLNKN